MERRDQYITITNYVDEDTGEVIPKDKIADYYLTSKITTTYERKQHHVRVIRTGTVRRSPQLKIEFPGNGTVTDSGKPVPSS